MRTLTWHRRLPPPPPLARRLPPLRGCPARLGDGLTRRGRVLRLRREVQQLASLLRVEVDEVEERATLGLRQR